MIQTAVQKKTKHEIHATEIDIECINNIRVLGAELPLTANSGHPGAPMGCAPIAHALFGYVMNFMPTKPEWINRDRFVLSNGHACALLYTMLYLNGYDYSLNDLKSFRKVNSKTPGHPESISAPGVEVCTGPLGQGISNAVGIAIMSQQFAAQYNKENYELFNNYVYVLCGDGCLQEGVSSEACSLAGHLKLNRLICLYDSNNITIDGECHLAFTEKIAQRYEAYGWKVLHVEDGNSSHAPILEAIEYSKENHLDSPTLIIVRTIIGFGSSKQGTEKVHGAPLAKEDLENVKKKLNMPLEPFIITKNTNEFYSNRQKKMKENYKNWVELYKSYTLDYKKESEELERRIKGDLINNLESLLPKFTSATKPNGTRAYSRECLNVLFNNLPEIIGGSADLKESNRVDVDGKDSGDFSIEHRTNRYIRFGVREHGMFAIANGMFAFGGVRPFVSTFLNFITYGWGAARLSALSRSGIAYIMTHDSIELGEDGPTHQPIETMSLIRATPNMIDIRPADGEECCGAYIAWIKHKHSPSVICLSRSATPPVLNGTCRNKLQYGAYIIKDFEDNNYSKIIIGSSGSELDLVIKAVEQMKSDNININVRIVSMPSWYLFSKQSLQYRDTILPKNIKKMLVEPYFEYGYEKYFDAMIGMKTFGASGNKNDVWKYFGFTKENIIQQATLLSQNKPLTHHTKEELLHTDHPFTDSVADFSVLN